MVVALRGRRRLRGLGRVSDKDYRAKADAICTSIKSQRDRLPPASNITELRAVARSTIAINTDALRRFKALDPPGDLRRRNDVIVTRLQQTLELQQQALKGRRRRARRWRRSTCAQGRRGRALVAAAQQAKLPACAQL